VARPEASGCVYVLSCASTPHLFKVGFTLGTAKRRLRRVGAQAPPSLKAGITVAREYRTDQPQRLEALLHRRLSQCRVAGSEWFHLDLASIEDAVERTARAHGIVAETVEKRVERGAVNVSVPCSAGGESESNDM
jgi:hypothetical protein